MSKRYEKQADRTPPITAALATMAMLFAPIAEAQTARANGQGQNQRYAQSRSDTLASRDTRRDDCLRLIRDLPGIMQRTRNTDSLEELAGCEDYPGFQNVINVANRVDAERAAAARRRAGQQ